MALLFFFKNNFLLESILKYLWVKWHDGWELLQNNPGKGKWEKIYMKQGLYESKC